MLSLREFFFDFLKTVFALHDLYNLDIPISPREGDSLCRYGDACDGGHPPVGHP